MPVEYLTGFTGENDLLLCWKVFVLVRSKVGWNVPFVLRDNLSSIYTEDDCLGEEE